MKTAIVTDSTAYLTPEEQAKYNISIIPLAVTIAGEVYDETDLSAAAFYDKVRTSKDFPKTTQPAIGRFVALFEQLKSEGYEEVVSIHLSSGISGTYQGAIQAGNMVEGITVHAFDSEISCAVQGFYVLKAGELAEQGASAATIITALEAMRPSIDAYFIVDDLAHLQRGGRLSAAAALIGGLLQVKPVLHFVDKVIVPYEKIRTRKKAMKRAEDMLAQAVKNDGITDVAIIEANCKQEATEWMNALQKLYPQLNFKISYFGPVIGTHLGEGAIGMGFANMKASTN